MFQLKLPVTKLRQNVTLIVTATKRTALNGTNEIDEVVTDYAKVHFEPCMPFDPKLSFEHDELRPGQGRGS